MYVFLNYFIWGGGILEVLYFIIVVFLRVIKSLFCFIINFGVFEKYRDIGS